MGDTRWDKASCWRARLVEAGVTFVTVDAGGWDTHANNFENLKTKKLPPFDQAWAALVQDLHQRGLAETTLVLVWGEFGRTPLINKGAGRDHWPSAQSVVVAGGGMRMGQAIGSTDAKAEKPRTGRSRPRMCSQPCIITSVLTLIKNSTMRPSAR